MLFVASPETPMAKACERGEAYGVEGYRRVSLDELDELYPGEPQQPYVGYRSISMHLLTMLRYRQC